jgi:hypothetical protein
VLKVWDGGGCDEIRPHGGIIPLYSVPHPNARVAMCLRSIIFLRNASAHPLRGLDRGFLIDQRDVLGDAEGVDPGLPKYLGRASRVDPAPLYQQRDSEQIEQSERQDDVVVIRVYRVAEAAVTPISTEAPVAVRKERAAVAWEHLNVHVIGIDVYNVAVMRLAMNRFYTNRAVQMLAADGMQILSAFMQMLGSLLIQLVHGLQPGG